MTIIRLPINVARLLQIKSDSTSVIWSVIYFIILFLYFPEVLPEMESQGEYEGQNFSFTSPDNMDNGGSQNLTKLTTANMEDMEEYYNFGKDTSSYTTPWVVMDQRTWFVCFFFLFPKQKENTELLSRLWETLGKGFSFSFGLLTEEPELLPDSDGRPGRRHTSKEIVSALLLIAETLKPLTRSGAPFLGLLH